MSEGNSVYAEPVKWSDVNPGIEQVALGTYDFRVIKATPTKWDPLETNVQCRITSEGVYNGESMFLKIPNAVKASKGVPANDPKNWVNKTIKRIAISLGHELSDGETVIEYFNRAAAEGAKFQAEVVDTSYIPKGGTVDDKVAQTGIKLGSVRPAA